MKTHKIEARLEHTGEKGTTAFLRVPFDVEKEFGAKRVPVSGTINGVPFRSTICCGPRLKVYGIPVCKELREQIGAEVGDTVTWEFDRDTAPRTVDPPPDLAREFRTSQVAASAWEKLSFTHQKEFARWIEEAKKPETRERRVAKAIEMLTAG